MNQDQRCGALTASGSVCRHKPGDGHEKCWLHRGPQCSVCFGPLTERGRRTLPCCHEFHTRCIDRWKRTCPGDPTCPMCRVPFDLPTYKCRLTIERVSDSSITTSNFERSNITSIMEGFGIDLRNLLPESPAGGRFFTDIHFDIDEGEDLDEILEELGIPS